MLKQIRYFQTIVRLNSFPKAAEECHISQSAISQQIQALERELGFSLLSRANRKFTLTPAGEHFNKKSLVLRLVKKRQQLVLKKRMKWATAECYTGEYADGTIAYNEDAAGLGLKGIDRSKIVIATKTGVAFSDGKMVVDASPARIQKSVEKSLERLQTDYIDLYYLHRIDPNVEPEVVAMLNINSKPGKAANLFP